MVATWGAVALLAAACAADREPGSLYGPGVGDLVVVDATLVVDRPLPDLFVRRTADPSAPYSLSMTRTASRSRRS